MNTILFAIGMLTGSLFSFNMILKVVPKIIKILNKKY
jgi:hypothetical protein